VVLGTAVLALIAAACGSGESTGLEVSFSQATPTPGPVLLVTATPPTADTPTPPPAITGLLIPIEGACLPQVDDLMPNAPRDYREGVHEGVDFYSYASCTDLPKGTPVLAVKTGRIVRADHGYQDLTPDTLAALEERVAAGEANAFDVVDAFRGRQVWIDHGGGVVTRYAHLSAVDEAIQVGMVVKVGSVVGYVGDSGTPESVRAPGTEDHLHFEIRVGDGYLGQGLPPAEVRALYEAAFAPEEAQ